MSNGDSTFPEEFGRRLAAVEQRIASALARSGRQRSEITLVAVSKKFSSRAIEDAYSGGCRHFGENYVQEFAEKHAELPQLAGAHFHLIGHLQSNKSRLAARLFQTVQTIDSPKLMKRLDAAGEEQGTRVEVMLEVKLAEEQSKTGCAPADVPQLIATATECSNVVLTGLMTIPPWSEDPEQSRPYFRQLAGLARQCGLKQLSMGMSNDLEAAIEEGATYIRVGTALFGQRQRPKPKTSAVSL